MKLYTPSMLCTLLSVACGSEPLLDADADAEASDLTVETEPLLQGAEGEQQIPAQVWKYTGSGAVIDGNPTEHWDQFRAASEAAVTEENDEASAGGEQRWVAFDPVTGKEYSIDVPIDVKGEISRRAREVRLQAGFQGSAVARLEEDGIQDRANQEVVKKGWSNGTDTRTRRFDNTAWPFRTIGQIGSGCSGTLIGPRHVLTAAHCVWSKTSHAWFGFTFRPGREGTCNTSSCEPYGKYDAIWYYTPAEFRDTTKTFQQVIPYDYAIVTTTGRPGDETGWIGYVAASNATIEDYCNPIPFWPGFLGRSVLEPRLSSLHFGRIPSGLSAGLGVPRHRLLRRGQFRVELGRLASHNAGRLRHIRGA